MTLRWLASLFQLLPRGQPRCAVKAESAKPISDTGMVKRPTQLCHQTTGAELDKAIDSANNENKSHWSLNRQKCQFVGQY
jgi:hypothetical protein